MEDAEDEAERDLIRADRALAIPPSVKKIYNREDERTLADLACRPCDDQEDQEQEEEEDEASRPKAIWKPVRPSVKEVEEHNLTHMPFRNWCIFCVKGKAKDDPHKRKIKQDEEQDIPIVSIDYMFMESREARLRRKELNRRRGGNENEEDKGMPILVLKDSRTKVALSRVVPHKGRDQYAIERLQQDIANLGYKKLILKSDNEIAIIALKQAVKRERDQDIILEESPEYDSMGNGEVERSIQEVQGQIRTIKLNLEANYNTKIKEDHPAIPWLVAHAGSIITRYKIGEDGKTAYQRWKGRRYARAIAEFGECVIYCKLGSKGIDKFDERWEEGIWLGSRDESDEILIGTNEGVVKARSVRRKAQFEDRWNADQFNNMKGTPWQPIPGVNSTEIKSKVSLEERTRDQIVKEVEEGEEEMHQYRRASIKRKDVDIIGLTPGCRGCIAINRKKPGGKSIEHNEECRKRHENKMRKTGDARIVHQDYRLLKSMQQEGEKLEKKSSIETPIESSTPAVSSTNPQGGVHQEGGAASSSTIQGGEQQDHPMQNPIKAKTKERQRDQRMGESSNDVEMQEKGKRQRDELTEEDSEEQAKKYATVEVEAKDQEGSIRQIYWACSFAHKQDKNYYDDVTGKQIKTELVLKARAEQLGEVKKFNVYGKVPIQNCWNDTGKDPIGVRWLTINKGDDENPEIRCRIVAKEFNTSKREDLFAATPPLEAKKMLFSFAVTEGIGYQKGKEDEGMKLDFIDIRRAYYHAEARRKLYITLPEGDQEEGMCGLLFKSLEGTRDAAQNWEYTYSKFMTDLGFERGKATPCIFTLSSKNLRVVVHGDDFTVLGHTKDLDWFRQAISDKFTVKFRGRIGPQETDLKAIRILNRVLEWTKEGLVYEADQRHAEIIKDQMGMKNESKGVSTPGVKGLTDYGCQELDAHRSTKFRAISARANYLSQDRSEIQFSVKELCRAMSCPKEDDWNKLKRLARYIVGKERCTIKYFYQDKLEGVTVWTDSDFASTNPVRHSINEQVKDEHFEMINGIELNGEAACRRSTSGGLILMGEHLIKSWSSTQKITALSSGEAEYYAIVKGAEQGMGVRSMLIDFQISEASTRYIEVKEDSSAAKGIASRRGLGKLKHVDIKELWIQEKVHSGDLKITKVPGTINLADALTKYCDVQVINHHINSTHQTLSSLKHPLTPSL